MSSDVAVQTRRANKLVRQRKHLLLQVESWLEPIMIWLGFAWVILIVLELLAGLNPFLNTTTTVIWAIFVVDFCLRFIIAPGKSTYLRTNWLTAVSLVLPALRLFRIFRLVKLLRAARAARGLRLLRLVGSVNRGMSTLRRTMRRRGLAYVAALTLVVLFSGAAGMYAFEREAVKGGLANYGEALWWTAMLLTSLGSQYWPQSAEGRVLCLLLSIYSLGILGYLTAALASLFIDQDAKSFGSANDATIAELKGNLQKLREENDRLRMEVQKLRRL